MWLRVIRLKSWTKRCCINIRMSWRHFLLCMRRCRVPSGSWNRLKKKVRFSRKSRNSKTTCMQSYPHNFSINPNLTQSYPILPPPRNPIFLLTSNLNLSSPRPTVTNSSSLSSSILHDFQWSLLCEKKWKKWNVSSTKTPTSNSSSSSLISFCGISKNPHCTSSPPPSSSIN